MKVSNGKKPYGRHASYKNISVLIKYYCCRMSEIEPKYYADGEDAYAMRRDLTEIPKFPVRQYYCVGNYVM